MAELKLRLMKLILQTTVDLEEESDRDTWSYFDGKLDAYIEMYGDIVGEEEAARYLESCFEHVNQGLANETLSRLQG